MAIQTMLGLARWLPDQVLNIVRMAQAPTKISHGDNAFDLIRLLLAVLVVYTHGRLLGGFQEDWLSPLIKHQTNPGSAAVLGFFGISGYLISQSYCFAPKWRTFLKRRALRILPAYYLAILFSAFVAAPLLNHINMPGQDAWHFRNAASFIERNAFLRIQAWTVGSETQGLPYTGSIDGALWSLFPEACCYLVILWLGIVGVLAQRRYELLGITSFLFVTNFGHCLLSDASVPLLPSFLVLSSNTPFFLAFAVGASVHSYRASIDLGRNGALVTGLLCIAILKFGGWAIFGPVILPLFVLNLAYSFRVRLSADLSYGIYVLHFPCEQILAAWNLQRYGSAFFFLCSTLACASWAVASWFFVERPALRLKG
jgi:peptidoglycan/LPS O-acetylase OafA/YrhL